MPGSPSTTSTGTPTTGKVDWSYLRGLSADAVPVFEGRSITEIACGLPRNWSQDDDWLSWNLGRHRARVTLDDTRHDLATALNASPTSALDKCPEAP